MRRSRKSIKAFLGGIRGCIKAHAASSLPDLIRLLNPRIRVWANYFRQLVSSRVFTKIDTAVFDAMVRWMRRRHPKKGLSWLRTKYFRSSGGRHWVITSAAGETASVDCATDLFRASSLPIRRHVKVQATATAFHPAFRDYFRELKKTRARVKAAEHVGSFLHASRPTRQRSPRPGRVTAAFGKA